MTAGARDEERPLPALRLAGKLESLQPGELIVVGADGNVIGRRRVRRRQIAVFGTLAAACTVAILTSPGLGIVYTAVLGGLTARQVSRMRQINRISRLLRARRLDDAEREVAALERRHRYGPMGAVAAYGRAQVSYHRGDHAAAVAAARRSAQLMRAPSRRYHIPYWSNQFLLATALFDLDRVDEARAALAVARGAPDGEYWTILKREMEAMLAFATDRPDDLGSDDELHDRARAALRYNHTGATVALLAWAYERRGDAEMAAHLASEAPARFLYGPEDFARMHPRLWAWLMPKLPPPEE